MSKLIDLIQLREQVRQLLALPTEKVSDLAEFFEALDALRKIDGMIPPATQLFTVDCRAIVWATDHEHAAKEGLQLLSGVKRGELTVTVKGRGLAKHFEVVPNEPGRVTGLAGFASFVEAMADGPKVAEVQRARSAGPPIPEDFPVKVLGYLGDGHEMDPDHPLRPPTAAACRTCRRIWDDGVVTEYTPVPSGRCPFEAFHE